MKIIKFIESWFDTDGAGNSNVKFAAGGNNRQAMIECRGESLDVTNGFSFVCLSVTVGTAATQLCAFLCGVNARYAPVASFNQAGVAQLV